MEKVFKKKENFGKVTFASERLRKKSCRYESQLGKAVKTANNLEDRFFGSSSFQIRLDSLVKLVESGFGVCVGRICFFVTLGHETYLFDTTCR